MARKTSPVYFDIHDLAQGTWLYVSHPEALPWINRWPYQVYRHHKGYRIRMVNVLAFQDLMCRLSRWGDPTYKERFDF